MQFRNFITIFTTLLIISIFLYAIPEEKKLSSEKKKTIPVTAYIISSEDGNFNSKRTKDDVYIMFNNVNYLWRDANLNFDVIDIKEKKLSIEELNSIVLNGNVLDLKEELNSQISAYFMNNLGTVNGFAIPHKNMIFISDVTHGNENSVLAHELGHLFGLEHSESEQEVMFNVCGGTEFNQDQIEFISENLNKVVE